MSSALSEEIKREVGKHFVYGFHGHEVNANIRTLICDHHLSNVILMKRNVRDVRQTRNMIEELQIIAKESGHERPLLIGIDQENGLVSAFTAGTQFPGAMALGTTASTVLTYDVALATGKELKMVGINWVYSPVADVNSNSQNPVIGVRSFGQDPVQVAKLVSAVASGFTSSGVAPSAKHFPGHGDTYVDSHLSLPRIMKSKQELERLELVPFRDLVGNTRPVASVMTGHMALPLLTGNDSPSSLSATVTQGLLREELCYDGVVVTDCLEMDAVAGTCGIQEGAVQALQAGADIVMLCHRFDRQLSAMEAVYNAILSGRLDINKLKISSERISRMKDLFAGGWDDVIGIGGDLFDRMWKSLKEANMELSRTAYRRTCSVIWGSNILPLRVHETKEILLFTPQMESLNAAVDEEEELLRDPSGRLQNPAGTVYLYLASKIQSRASCTHIVYCGPDTIPERLSTRAGVVIFVLRNADRAEWQKAAMKKVLRLSTSLPVLLLSSCGPYDLDGEDVCPTETAYIRTYEFTPSAFDAFTNVIFE